jgi:hypothetical protein
MNLSMAADKVEQLQLPSLMLLPVMRDAAAGEHCIGAVTPLTQCGADVLTNLSRNRRYIRGQLPMMSGSYRYPPVRGAPFSDFVPWIKMGYFFSQVPVMSQETSL